MSIGASLLRGVYRLSGVKKAFALPVEQLLKAIEKANRGRGFFMPSGPFCSSSAAAWSSARIREIFPSCAN